MVFKNVSLQVSLPVPTFFPKIIQLGEKIPDNFQRLLSTAKVFLFSVFGKIKAMRERKRLSLEPNLGAFQEKKPRLRFRKYIKPIIVIAVLATVFIFGARALGNRGSVAGDQIEVGTPEKTKDISREFAFPLLNSKGEKIAEVKYMIEKAELIDEIIVKGQRATAVKGRTFLIINLKISNDFTSPVEIQTRDYIRLSVNGNEEEWMAPDIHNDPVEVQAISTKYSRVGYPINDSDTNLVLRVGEIQGEKEKIPLEF